LKKIIIITHNFPPEAVGGASRIFEMARELQKSFHVEVICAPPTYPFTKFPFTNKLIQHEIMNKIPVHRIWTYQPKEKSPSFLSRVSYYIFYPILVSFYLIKKNKGDTIIIITNPPPTLLIASLIARIFRKKYIVDMRDFWIDAAISLGFIKNKFFISCLKKFENYCLKKSSMIITNSMYIQKILSQEYVDKKIKYIPFNVNLTQFKKIKCDIENDLVYIGNIGTAQNLEKVIQAISLVIKQLPKIRIEIYGGGDEEEVIKKQIKKLGLDQNILIHNPVPREEIPKILSKSKIGIVPLANNENLAYAIPTKTFEYMACEVPIIAYGSSEELKRIMTESNSGIFVEGDVNKLAENILLLLNDKELIESYKKNGREFLMKQNSFKFLEGQ
tara:strand:+ start:962 stop:2125 length:1164 start_codon:yes stop_codon:yes gene_type:complete